MQGENSEEFHERVRNLAQTTSQPPLAHMFVRHGQYNPQVEFGACIYEEKINKRSPCIFMGAIKYNGWLFTAERMSFANQCYFAAFHDAFHYTFCEIHDNIENHNNVSHIPAIIAWLRKNDIVDITGLPTIDSDEQVEKLVQSVQAFKSPYVVLLNDALISGRLNPQRGYLSLIIFPDDVTLCQWYYVTQNDAPDAKIISAPINFFVDVLKPYWKHFIPNGITLGIAVGQRNDFTDTRLLYVCDLDSTESFTFFDKPIKLNTVEKTDSVDSIIEWIRTKHDVISKARYSFPKTFYGEFQRAMTLLRYHFGLSPAEILKDILADTCFYPFLLPKKLCFIKNVKHPISLEKDVPYALHCYVGPSKIAFIEHDLKPRDIMYDENYQRLMEEDWGCMCINRK